MAQTFDTKLSIVACNYLKLLDVKVTQTSAKKSIEENPYYPSLLSLSDALTRYHIANEVYEIEPESFSEHEAPFIAFANMPSVGNDFVLVTTVTTETVSYLYDKKKPTTVTKTEFLRQFKDIVLCAEPSAESGEPDYEKKLAAEKATQTKKTWWGIAVAAVVILAIFANVTIATAVAFSIITAIKLTGLTAAILLLIFDINKDATATYDEPAATNIKWAILNLSEKIKLPPLIYHLGIDALKVEVNQNQSCLPQILHTHRLYYQMAKWYWHLGNKSKAIEALEKGIEALKNEIDFNEKDLATLNKLLKQYKTN